MAATWPKSVLEGGLTRRPTLLMRLPRATSIDLGAVAAIVARCPGC